MPTAPLRPCAQPRCSERVARGYCASHKPKERTALAQPRPTAHQRGYGSRWQTARATFLRKPENAICRSCKADKRLTPATVVDHIIPHKGSQALFWDNDNWQPLCKPCHDAKTAAEDGGFGNRQNADLMPQAGG